ncbi:MAG: hypothetical protein N2038_01710 [Geminicoccaceae bacterium]|nr:hypothetical protein [Geminicoccaceae bacterium]MCS7267775.1 hypothetical protein [Geminicoccaceae bacterium]MCX7628946.1 hypothetical protein [Geminicoccaceae bacterium]MDW8124329.1 hypothetical protein [Geminicoccaceae bacterium]MDW8340372.1 hypothetical protein [Geminicoccaceae bacterium]
MDPRGVPATSPAPPRGVASERERLREVAVEFEAVFLSQMLRGISAGLGPSGLFGKEPFGSLLADEYARLIARTGGVGIAEATYRELLRIQGANR